MKLSNKYGKCVLCGERTVLTFEHIPPRNALNNSPTKMYDGFEVMINGQKYPWDFNGRKYNNSQRGLGKYTLCKKCNNNTGTWYAKDYCDFANRMYITLKGTDIPNIKDTAVMSCKDLYPLRIFKQIICMFLSVNDAFELNDLREFVREKNCQGFDKSKYKVCMYINIGTIEKLLPKTVVCRSGGLNGPLDNVVITTVSEISTVPLGFILYFEPNDKTEIIGTDITCFCDYTYDDRVDFEIPLLFKEVNTPNPIDFRTKVEVKETIKRNKKFNIISKNQELL